MKNINLNFKEWFDKKNGNSYFCGTIKIDNNKTFLIPFQYGYGTQYLQECKNVLTEFNVISLEYGKSLKAHCSDNNINLNINFKDSCLKRELKNIEKEYNNNLKQ
jgi:hypothetical protein